MFKLNTRKHSIAYCRQGGNIIMDSECLSSIDMRNNKIQSIVRSSHD